MSESSAPPSSLQELHKEASNELATLKRVSHRLAMTDAGPQLEKVLSLLLPRLLRRIGSNQLKMVQLKQHAQPNSLHKMTNHDDDSSTGVALQASISTLYNSTHATLIEMMSHIMKRVRADSSCQLPCSDLLQILYDPESHKAIDQPSINPFTLNLALTFLTIGLPRCDMDELEQMLPGLVTALEHHSCLKGWQSASRKNQAFQLAHLVLRAVEGLVLGHRKKRGSNHSSSLKRKTDGHTSKSDETNNSSGEKEVQVSHPMDVLRQMCSRNDSISATLYDLFLDVLVYQNSKGSNGAAALTDSNLPPPGISQIGKERLAAGNSTVAKNWALEVASGSRLKDLKVSLLEFIAPSRRYDVFHVSRRKKDERSATSTTVRTSTTSDYDDDDYDDDINNKNDDNAAGAINESPLAVARAVALLIVAQGDQNLDVAGRASSYLKSHMDSLRNNTSRTNGNGGGRAERGQAQSQTGAGDNDNAPATDTVRMLLGHPIALVSELLGLVLGGVIADGAFKKFRSSNGNSAGGDFQVSLGRTYLMVTDADSSSVISTKRRMVPQQNATSIMTFITTRVVDDLPTLFTPTSVVRVVDSMARYFESCAERGTFVGMLTIMVANKYAGSGNSLSGLSLTSSVGNPSVASVKLLNSTCVRLAGLFDAMTAANEDDSERCDELWITSVHDILARAFANACNIVSIATSSHSGDVQNSIGIEARDAAYGMICTICRSNAVSFGKGVVFHCGDVPSTDEHVLSTKTAKTLFGCVSNEAETLKPRAVAALDSLLSSYCRLLKKSQSSKAKDLVLHTPTSNPWEIQIDRLDNKERNDKTQFEGLTKSLLPLLWNALHPTSPKASRHAAAQWADSLLKPLDLNSSCHILCFIAGDTDVSSSTLALNGLGLSEQIGTDVITSTPEGQDISVPDFHDFADAVFADKLVTTSWRPNFLHFSPRGKGIALRYGLICLLSDLYGGEDSSITKYLDCISKTLQGYEETSQSSKKSRDWIELLDEASICFSALLKSSGFARQSIADDKSHLNISQLAHLALSVPSSKARRYLASAYLNLLSDASIFSGGEDFDINIWIQKSAIDRIIKVSEDLLSDMSSPSFATAKIHGAAFVGANCVRALRIYFEMEGDNAMLGSILHRASRLVHLLGRGTLHSEEVIGNACANALAIAFSFRSNDAPVLCKELHESTISTLKFLNISLRRFGNGDHTNPQRATSLVKATGILLASTTVHTQSNTAHSSTAQPLDENVGKKRLDCVDALFFLLGSSANRKDSELALAVGEALAMHADAYSPEGCKWTYPEAPTPTDFEQAYADELPPHAHVLYITLHRELLATSPHKRTSVGPVLLAFVGRAAKMLHQNAATKQRDFIKEVCMNLTEIQTAFLKLLADPKSKQIGRESCQLGLAACYAISIVASTKDGNDTKTSVNSDVLNEGLLRAFGQTSNYGGSALMENRAQHQERIGSAGAAMMEQFGTETDIGGAAGISEAALGAFREMASASVVLNRPDILYSLMLLSVSLPTWKSTDYNAVSLLGSTVHAGGNIEEIRHALRPHLKKLIPRLLRACNDPNKQTREQMSALWVGISGGGADARTLVSKYLVSTIDSLIDDATNKLWRTRVGACSALAEIIVGRSWQDLGGGGAIIDCNDNCNESSDAASRLLRLYRVTIRSLDDVRLTVREAGETLSRSVRSLTARLCNPNIDAIGASTYAGITKESIFAKLNTSSAAASTALPWLVKIGLNQTCAEASGFAVACLLNIIEVSRPETLQPVLPDLIGSLLMAMSGLEPAALNYLQERVAGRDSNTTPTAPGNGYNRLERIRLQMAQSGPLAGALAKCIEMLKNVDIECQKSVIPELDSALRRGAGFATRAAAADAVSSLCALSPEAFKFSGNSTSNPTVRLLRALYYASERERGTGAKDKMSHALGNLAALAPGSSVRSLATRLCERYNTAVGGTNDDPTARRAVAAALRAIAVRASNQFSDGGANNVWIKYVLPLAFIARKDSDVGPMFQEIWDEGGEAARLGNTSTYFGVQLQETILPYLTEALIEALEDVSWSRRIIACTALSELSDANILAPAPGAVDDSFADEEYVSRTTVRAALTTKILTACVKLVVQTRIWNGKGELLRTITKISSKWLAPMKSNVIPWVPIMVVSKSKHDLFVGDSWFLSSEHQEEDEQCSELVLESMDSKQMELEDNKINFKNEEENILNIDDDEDEEMTNDADLTSNGLDKIQPITFCGLCRLLLEQGLPANIVSLDDHLSYRSAGIEGLANMLESIESQHLEDMRNLVAPRLLPIMKTSKLEGHEIPPLITAKCFKCYTSILYKGIGNTQSCDLDEMADLIKMFLENCGPMQPAWTVREGAGLAAAKLATCGHFTLIRKMSIIDDFIECTDSLLKDRKFWKVRLAGLKIIISLCSRANTHSTSRTLGMGSSNLAESSDEKERQLLLEAILPYKERIQGIARSCMADNEAKVTAAASEIMSDISWWP